MQRIFTLLICAALTLCTAACAKPENGSSPAGGAITEKWLSLNNTCTAWFGEEYPEDSVGVSIDTEVIRVGKNAGGKASFALIRLPLEATWYAKEITGARLFLKIAEGSAPAKLQVGALPQLWDTANTTRAAVQAMMKAQPLTEIEVKQEPDGWISLAVTELVKSWLSGETPNYGLAIFGEESVCSFVSGGGGDSTADAFPYLLVSGAAGKRSDHYGKFSYTETPLPGAASDEGGNCMSYALRDTNMILIDVLNADFGIMNKIYEESGEDAVAEYFADLVMDYVEANKAGLQVSKFRRIDGFNASIDPQTEYRIALRVGCKVFDDQVDLEERGMFDYHFWAQLSDGHWAQKFPLDPSEIIPCSAPDLSPGKYPWNAAIMWYGKTQDYYTSKVIYFAVTKDTDEFTLHRNVAN
jgi:hypothetical protein